MQINKKLILVDDDHDVRDVICDVFEEVGYPVISYASGREAIQGLPNSDEEYYALVTDFNMPEMNGVELIRQFVERHYKVKLFIIISGYVDRALEVKSTYLGEQLPNKIYFVDKLDFKKVIFDLLDGNLETTDLVKKT